MHSAHSYIMKKLLPPILFILSFSAGFFFLSDYSFYGNSNTGQKNIWLNSVDSSSVKEPEEKDSLISVKISVVGDIMCHTTQMKYAEVSADSFDFNPVFRELSDYLKSSDLLMGNLETVLAGRASGLKGYPVFNSPDELLIALKENGFDHLFLSNNHVMDMGWEGAERTAKFIKDEGLTYSGILSDSSGNDSVIIRETKGVKVGIVSFTYAYNNRSSENRFRILRIGKNRVDRLIKTAKKNYSADIVIVYFHFGDEYSRVPNEFQKKAVKWAIDSGADLIFGSHPHVIQPLQLLPSDQSVFDSVLVAYSLGNFVSNQRWRFSDCGVILNVVIEKNIKTNKFKLANVNYLPIWVYKGITDKKKREYIIYPGYPDYFDSFPEHFTKTDSINYMQSYYDTKRALDSLGYVVELDSIK